MNIRERAEGTPVEEGAQVTETNRAQYFYFRQGNQIVNVRVPKEYGERISIREWTVPLDDIREAPADDWKFLEEARIHGRFEVIGPNKEFNSFRVIATIGNQSRPFDMSSELLGDLGLGLRTNGV